MSENKTKTIDEVIKRLQELKEKYGSDVPIYYDGDSDIIRMNIKYIVPETHNNKLYILIS